MSTVLNPCAPALTRRKFRLQDFAEHKQNGDPIVMVTAYDSTSARLAELAGIEVILVGDSVAMVCLGHDTTLPVTMEQMLHHARAVARGACRLAAHLTLLLPVLRARQALHCEALRRGHLLARGLGCSFGRGHLPADDTRDLQLRGCRGRERVEMGPRRLRLPTGSLERGVG